MILTTAVNKIRRIKERKKIIQGGSSAGKTVGILIILIDYAIKNPNTLISVVSDTLPNLRRGAIRDFLKIMKETNRYDDNRYNRSNQTYTFVEGSVIEFFSVDKPDTLKGARRDILYVNECNNINYESYQQLSLRTNGDIYLDFNPDRSFWAITEVVNEPDAKLIILNYLDNEALEKNIISQFKINIEKSKTSDYWKNWCKVYIDGELGSLEGVIFNNWKTINNIPKEARLIGMGMDFGFTNDPTTLIEVYQYNNKYILNELIYQTELTLGDIHKLFQSNGVSKNDEIWCDSAEPRTIKELKNRGWKTLSTAKGRDSIIYGIQLMQDVELLITESSHNLLKELRNYMWMKKNGEKINTPIGVWNHAIDAVRYLFLSKMGKKKNRTPF